MGMEDLPIIVPYRLDESWQGRGDELRLFLRSVDRNVTGLSRVCLVTDQVPGWLNLDEPSLMVVDQGNPFAHCKDANLFLKVQLALEALGGPARWCFSADDSMFLWPCDLRVLPVVFNGSTRDWYAAQNGKWYRRMVHTFDWLAEHGVRMDYAYDCHVPQVFSLTAGDIAAVPYGDGQGFCIYTLWRGLEGICRGGVYQPLVVSRYASPEDVVRVRPALPFCTYNDPPFGAGLRELLFRLFPDKSRFEK